MVKVDDKNRIECVCHHEETKALAAPLPPAPLPECDVPAAGTPLHLDPRDCAAIREKLKALP